MMIIKRLLKAKFLFVLCFCMIGGAAIAYDFFMNNDPIHKSTLPQNQLWSIEYAEEMQRKAFNIGIPSSLDKAALLELIKHAWQWDKNAMIQYARIVQNEREVRPGKGESLDEFIIRYRSEIVDAQGRLLNEPPVLRLPFWQFMEKLAELGYPHPARRLASRGMGGEGEDTKGNFIPYNASFTNKMLTYIRCGLEGGYRNYKYFADMMLFRTGYPSKDRHFNAYHRLPEHAPDLSSEELSEAMDAYKLCAEHGSSYCMTRLAEGYFYGIGVEKDLMQAYIWAELSNQGYAQYLASIQGQVRQNLFEQKIHRNLNQYNLEILSLIKAEITPEQTELAANKLEEMGEDIVWDYDSWSDGRDPVPPMP